MSDSNDLLTALEAFEASFPEVLKHTRHHTRTQLEQLYQRIPALTELIQTDQRLRNVATEGRQALAQTSRILGGINDSTENAVNEILMVLQNLVDSEGQGVKLKLPPEEIRTQLMMAMNALQFQDIVAQQIRAIQALLNAYDTTLAPLADAPDEQASIDVQGAFDASARFDRDQANQDDIDAWLDEAKGET